MCGFSVAMTTSTQNLTGTSSSAIKILNANTKRKRLLVTMTGGPARISEDSGVTLNAGGFELLPNIPVELFTQGEVWIAGDHNHFLDYVEEVWA